MNTESSPQDEAKRLEHEIKQVEAMLAEKIKLEGEIKEVQAQMNRAATIATKEHNNSEESLEKKQQQQQQQVLTSGSENNNHNKKPCGGQKIQPFQKSNTKQNTNTNTNTNTTTNNNNNNNNSNNTNNNNKSTPKRFGTNKVVCPTCNDRVYPLEAIKFEEKTYHKGCFKCYHCKKPLTLTNVAVTDGKVFCKPHFKELMKKGGGRYSFATDSQ